MERVSEDTGTKEHAALQSLTAVRLYTCICENVMCGTECLHVGGGGP